MRKFNKPQYFKTFKCTGCNQRLSLKKSDRHCIFCASIGRFHELVQIKGECEMRADPPVIINPNSPIYGHMNAYEWWEKYGPRCLCCEKLTWDCNCNG